MKKLFFLLALVLTTQMSSAQNKVLNYQGVLLNSEGQPVSDDTYSAVFELYSSISSSVPVWTNANASIRTVNGAFKATLGLNVPFGDDVDFTQVLFLAIAVDGQAFGSRVRIDPNPGILTVKEQNSSLLNEAIVELKANTQSKIDSLAAVVTELTNALQASLESRGSSVPIGTVQAFAGDTASIPDGWLLCDGSKYPISQYEKLAEVLNNYWGAQDFDFFVPDLTGQFLRGASATVANLDDLKERRNNGTSSGDLVGLFQGWTTGPSRIRAFTGITGSWGSSAHPTTGVGNHSHSANASLGRYNDAGQNGGWAREGNHGTRAVTNPAGAHNHTVDLRHTHTITVTAGGDLETRPANAFVHYIIKAK